MVLDMSRSTFVKHVDEMVNMHFDPFGFHLLDLIVENFVRFSSFFPNKTTKKRHFLLFFKVSHVHGLDILAGCLFMLIDLLVKRLSIHDHQVDFFIFFHPI